MHISTDAIIPITDATRSFKNACEKTKELGTTFIFKNNRPDIVMMDMKEYQRFVDLLETLEHAEIATLIDKRKDVPGKRYSLDEVVN